MKDKLLKFKNIGFFIFFFCQATFSQVHYKLNLQYRSTPSAKNIVGTAAYDGLLWGSVDKELPLYGYYKLGVVAGGAPTMGTFFELAPVAPLVFKFQKSSTYRFLESSIFDCVEVFCYGTVDRTETSVSLGLGYKSIVGVLSYLNRDIRSPASSKLVLLEQENFLVVPGHQTYHEMTIFSGYKLNPQQILGIHYTMGEISEGSRQIRALYGIFQWKWHWTSEEKDDLLDVTLGLGSYQTDQDYVSGNGILFAIGKKFGESLSLF